MIYAVNQANQGVAPGASVLFPTVLFSANRTVVQNGAASFLLTQPGVYEIEIEANVSGAESSTAESPETYSLAIAVNGSVSAETTMTVTVPTAESQMISRKAVISQMRCCPCVSGLSISVINASETTTPTISNATICIRRLS